MNTSNYGPAGAEIQRLSPTEQQQAEAEKRLEWECRVRSHDPKERGAGWWPSPFAVDPKGLPDIDLFLSARGAAFVELTSWRSRVVGVIEDPMGEALRAPCKPGEPTGFRVLGHPDEYDTWADSLTFDKRGAAHRYFLNWAGWFGATIVELKGPNGRVLVFDVVLDPSPCGPGGGVVQRWMLSFRRDHLRPTIIQAQIPANQPMLGQRLEIQRTRSFPHDQKLENLIASNFNPAVGTFEFNICRRHARDLRKGLFGAMGLRDVPEEEGVREFHLPRGWTLRLHYAAPGWFETAGSVLAKFIPPATEALKEAA